MFSIVCVDPDLKRKLEDPRAAFPPEVAQELASYLEVLKRDGQVSKTDFYDTNTHRISANTFYLFYRPNIVFDGANFLKQEVLIISVKLKPADVFRKRFQIQDNWDDKDVVESIPQYDQPRKLIQAINLIQSGTVDSYDLGYALNHRGKKREYITRHGNYAKHLIGAEK
jgi:hypothetical protein